MKQIDCNTNKKKYTHIVERDRYKIEGVITFDSAGSISSALPVIAHTLNLNAAAGITLATKVSKVTAAVITGPLELYEKSEIVLKYVVNNDGAVKIIARASVTVENVESLADKAGGDILAAPDSAGINLAANKANLSAGGNIGSAQSALKTELAVLTATADNSITVQEADDVMLEDISTGHCVITITTGGTMVIGIVNATDQGEITLVAVNSIVSLNPQGVALNIIAHDASLTAGRDSGILKTKLAELSASVISNGDIEIREEDAIVLNRVINADGAIHVIAGDTITAVYVVSLCDNSGNTVGLLSLNGDILVDCVAAGVKHGQVSLSSSADIRELNDDQSIDVRAG